MFTHTPNENRFTVIYEKIYTESVKLIKLSTDSVKYISYRLLQDIVYEAQSNIVILVLLVTIKV
jgi:hypothetical protein